MKAEDKFVTYRKTKENSKKNFFRIENIFIFLLLFSTITLAVYSWSRIQFLLETKTEEGKLISILRQNAESLSFDKNIVMRQPGHCLVSCIDVGQGDATLIETPNGRVILIDGGEGKNPDNKFAKAMNAGERIIIPFLWAKKIKKINTIVMTHAHSDHIGGLTSIMDIFPVDEFIDPGYPSTSSNYVEILRTIKTKNIKYIVANIGDVLDWGKDVFAEVLWVDKSGGKNGDNINNTSIVIFFQFGKTKFIFSGDAEKEIEEQIVMRYGENLKCDFYKVGHHGSKTSSTEMYVKMMKPDNALIYVGSYNTFGHPTQDVLKRLESYKTKIYRTDKESHIYIDMTEEDYKIITAANMD